MMIRTRSLALIPLLLGSLAPVAAAQNEKQQAVAPPAEEELKPVDVFQGAGILVFKTPDDRFKWWLDGRIMIDSAMYANSDNQLSNGIEIRRARLALNMVLWKDWASQFDIEYVQDNTIEIKDMWIGYTGLPNQLIKVGNFKTPFGLETLTSSRYITFMERSLTDNFSPDRRIGAAYSAWGSRWQGSGGIFGQAVGDVDATGQDQGYAVVGRLTGLPVKTDKALVHLGLAGSYMTPDAATTSDLSDANQMRLRARPETHVNRGRFIDTKKINNVDHQRLLGLEAAAAYGSLSFQSEYNKAAYKRTVDTLPTPSFDAWYAFASWFPTGEHRPYDTAAGEFERVIPKSTRGAIELAVRYSNADLNDPSANILGGKENITTFGANWYANSNIRVMVNYSFVNNDQYAKGDRSYKVNDDFNILQARFQLMF